MVLALLESELGQVYAYIGLSFKLYSQPASGDLIVADKASCPLMVRYSNIVSQDHRFKL